MKYPSENQETCYLPRSDFSLRLPLIKDTVGHRGDTRIRMVMGPSRTLDNVRLLSEFGSRLEKWELTSGYSLETFVRDWMLLQESLK